VFVPRQPLVSEENATERSRRVEGILNELGLWEDATDTLNGLWEELHDQSTPEETGTLGREDVEVHVTQQREPFRGQVQYEVVVGLTSRAAQNSRLHDSSVWKRSLRNIPRWKKLCRVVGRLARYSP